MHMLRIKQLVRISKVNEYFCVFSTKLWRATIKKSMMP